MMVLPFVIATYVWRVQDLVSVLGAIKFPLLLGLGALAVFFATNSGLRRLRENDTPMARMVIGIAILIVIGVPFSLIRGGSLSFFLKDYLPTLLLAMMVAAGIRHGRDLEWLLRTTIIGATLYCGYIFFRFHVGANGRLGGLVYYDANDVSLLIVCTLPLIVYFLRPGMRAWDRALAAGAFCLLILTLIKAGSRGGFLGLIAVMVALITWYRGIPRSHMMLVIAGGFAILSLRGSDQYWALMKTLLHPTEDPNWTGGDMGEGRMAIWKRGMGYMAHHPFLGVGARAFPRAEGVLSDRGQANLAGGAGFKWSAAHNSFVEIGAETGIFGLILFTSLFVYTIRAMARLNRKRGPPGSPVGPREAALAQTIAVALIAFCVSGFFVSANYFAYPYVLLAFAAGLLKVTRVREAAAAQEVAGSAGPMDVGPVQPTPTRIPGMRGGAAIVQTVWRKQA
ncbi:MAG TPA: O-antigen ligase family protein [Gemmatimonadaceae bacterium]|nr:O-antigen ligase family protein [Gemmatimonadaceae bacterium]